MKPKLKAPSTQDALTSVKDKTSQRYLKHILSPLELSALQHNYQPFNYKFEGHFIYISGSACKQLMQTTKHQLSFFTNQIEKDKHFRKIPRRLREVVEDPSEILSLQAYTRNALCRLHCFTMLSIMILGRQYFLERKEFGTKSIKTIEHLFAKHKATHLFK